MNTGLKIALIATIGFTFAACAQMKPTTDDFNTPTYKQENRTLKHLQRKPLDDVTPALNRY